MTGKVSAERSQSDRDEPGAHDGLAPMRPEEKEDDRGPGEKQVLVSDQGRRDEGGDKPPVGFTRLRLADEPQHNRGREEKLERVLHAEEDQPNDVARHGEEGHPEQERPR